MKILFISPVNKQYNIFTYYLHIYLKKMYKNVFLLDYRKKLIPWEDRLFRSFSVIGYCNNLFIWFLFVLKAMLLRPDIIFIAKGEIFRPLVFKIIRRIIPKVIIINWFMDSPHLNTLAEKLCRNYDLFFINDSSSINSLCRLNPNVFYIPFGYIKEYQKKVKLTKEEYQKYRTDICFIGSYSREREIVLSNLKRFGLSIYGPGWEKAVLLKDKVKGYGLYNQEISKAFTASKIVINIHQNFIRKNNKKLYGSSINVRVCEAMASNSFLLTDRKQDVIDIFREGKELECYGTIRELKRKAAYYLKNESKRNKIRTAGCRAVKRISLDKILKKMFSLVKEYQKNNEIDFKKNNI